jgi:isopentenyl phosphate kinase
MGMSGVVIIKWGGGLITKKDTLCVVNHEVLNSLAQVAAESSKRLIIVHGAGSFGHIKAKQFCLADGDVEDLEQKEAIEIVRNDMMLLNSEVMSSLESAGLNARSYPPHRWAKGLGPHFSGQLPLYDGITVLFGDVVDDETQGFGILSGDDLVFRYAVEVPNVERVIFAIHGVDGLLKVPPSRAQADDLIEVWSEDIAFEGEHATEFDVTGGIGLKAARGALIAEHGIEVLMVNGERPDRILAAIEGQPVRGTRIVRRNS